MGTKNVSGRTQRGKIEAYLCVSQESSNCRYPMQDVQTGLTKKEKEKEEKKKTKTVLLQCGRGVKIKGFGVGINSTNKKELVSRNRATTR